MIRRNTAEHSHEKKLMEQRESRMHHRAIQHYSDLHKRYTTRAAEFEESNKLRDETEVQQRHQLQSEMDELRTSQQIDADKVEELDRLRVLLREEAEIFGDDDNERGLTSSAQNRHRVELEESLENVRI
jgi:beta-N-acetylglucosaminidase